MADAPDLKFLLDEILSGDAKRQQQARIVLLAMDEDAVPPLVDAFYAGVTEAQGVVLLDIVAEIGGPDAIQLLEDVSEHPGKPAWERWALLGLARNFREDILDTMLDWLQDGDTAQRQTAALALGYIGEETVELALVHALHDPEVAPQAVRALAYRESIAALADGYAVDHAEVWALVTDALLALGDAGTLPLIEIVQTEHEEFYDKVMISLENSPRPEAREVLQAADFYPDGSRKDG
jgi:HEAT repeat protein